MIRLSINRPTTVAMIYIAIAVVGIASFLDIPVELLPDVEYPQLSIETNWPGASPEVVEAFLTAPLEGATQQVRGVRKIESESSEGQSEITVEFARGTDMDFARLELGERIQSIRDELPPDVRPQVALYIPREFQTGERVDMRYTLSGSYTFERLRRYAEDELRPQLVALDGVEEVAVWGGEDREIRIELDRGRMEAFGVRPTEVAGALTEAELIRTAGKLKRDNTEWVVTIRNAIDAAAELASLIVVPDTLGTGEVVRISDIADIHDTTADPVQFFRIDGRPAIMLSLVRGVGTNALRVADAVKAKVDELRSELMPGTWLTLEYDGSREIEQQLTDLRLRALAAAIVIFLVLLLFLGSFRTAGIVFATVVFSVLIAVNLLYFGKFSLNVLTMAGLAMGFGLMVDNSIVVLENIYRRRRAAGEQAWDAADRGTRQVALPIVAGTLTTIIVFLPFLYLQGELRLYYLPFAYAVGFSLLASLFVAFTFVPGLAARALAGGAAGIVGAGRPAMPFYVRLYRGVLSFALDHPVIIIVLTAAAFGGSYRLFDKHVVKGAVWGRGWGQQTYIQIYFNMPRGAELERTDGLVREFERRLLTIPEIERFTANVMPERAFMRVTFPDSLENTYVPVAIKEQLVAYSYLFAGAEVRVYGYGPSFYGGGSSPPTYTVKLLGYNYEIVRDIAEDMALRLRRFNRVREVDTNMSNWWWTDKAFEFYLGVNRPKLAAYGLSVEELLRFVSSNVRGQVSLDRIKVGGEEVTYSVKLEGYRDFDFNDLRELLVPTPTGERVRLQDVAQVGRREVLNRIVRENQQYQRLVGWEFRGVAGRLLDREGTRLLLDGGGAAADLHGTDLRHRPYIYSHGDAVRVAARALRRAPDRAARLDRCLPHLLLHRRLVHPLGLHRCRHDGGHRGEQRDPRRLPHQRDPADRGGAQRRDHPGHAGTSAAHPDDYAHHGRGSLAAHPLQRDDRRDDLERAGARDDRRPDRQHHLRAHQHTRPVLPVRTAQRCPDESAVAGPRWRLTAGYELLTCAGLASRG